MEGNKVNKNLKLEDYSVQNLLGVGSFGKVKLVRNKKNKKISCVKIMKKAQIIQSKQADHIINQCKILRQVSHPLIVNFEGLSQNNKYLYLFMEYIPGGEMFTHLRDQGCFQPHKAAFYGAQIMMIFDYLHSKDIIYRDLKPQNILLGKDGYIKLTDFGFAKKIENRTFTLCGTPQYLAPEILLNQGHGKPVDWWTLGIILYEMIAGIDPFTDKDAMSIYHNILKCKLKFPKDFDADAKSLVKHLLILDLSKRFGNLKNGVNDIKKHRYFASISLGNLLTKKISAPWKPPVKSDDDISNFGIFEDSLKQSESVKEETDPFLIAF